MQENNSQHAGGKVSVLQLEENAEDKLGVFVDIQPVFTRIWQ